MSVASIFRELRSNAKYGVDLYYLSNLLNQLVTGKSTSESDITALQGDVTAAQGDISDLQSTKPAMVLPLSGPANTYLERVGDTYAAVAQFEFPGSVAWLSPTHIRALVHWDNGGLATKMAIRVYDVTNAHVICEKLNIADIVPTAHDLGTLTDIPAGRAVWEVQVKTDNAGGGARASYVGLIP